MNQVMGTGRSRPGRRCHLPPPDVYDPVIEEYKRGLDQSLLRQNLRLTPEQRLLKFEQMMRLVFELRNSARKRGLIV